MIQRLSRFILYRLMGWTECLTQPIPDKCIICVAPHTSNWDFIIGKLYYAAKGRTSQFLMKREWFRGPLGPFFRSMGGISVERSKHTSLTDQLADYAIHADTFSLAVTPEGTRSKATQWKRGFYFIAHKAQLPILLFALDFKEKKIVCTQTLIPSGHVDEDLRTVMNYYKGFHARHPEKFCVEDI